MLTLLCIVSIQSFYISYGKLTRRICYIVMCFIMSTRLTRGNPQYMLTLLYIFSIQSFYISYGKLTRRICYVVMCFIISFRLTRGNPQYMLTLLCIVSIQFFSHFLWQIDEENLLYIHVLHNIYQTDQRQSLVHANVTMHSLHTIFFTFPMAN